MEEMIKFSILVPVYQVEKYIDECIQSVLAQTYSNWELILVDDGTKDRSGEICDQYGAQDARIHVYHKENGGLMHTRRYGIARATGDYYIFLDSDDTIKPHALQTIYDTIQKHDCDCVIYGYERFLNGKVTEVSPKEEEKCITDRRELYKKCCFVGYGYLWRKAVKATAFKGVDYSPYYHIQLLEDELQTLEILEGSQRVYFIDDKLYNYRINPNSITEGMSLKNAKGALEVRQKVLEFFREQDVFNEADYVEYGTCCLSFACGLIGKLSTVGGNMKERTQILQQIKEEKLYKDIMQSGMYDKKRMRFRVRVIFELYSRNHYKILRLISKGYMVFLKWKKKAKALMGRNIG